MTALRDEFEALMPEPVFAFRDKGTFTLSEPFYAADQVRAAMQSVAERAAKKEREGCAKLCDEQSDFYMEQARGGDQSGASDHKACAAVECADAIRSTL
ncbi:hypothetical protein [Variovorax sp. tm]|uniref:hypothetical protein n=1 Tax=Variovorax atrisoli TaxID=3394203 RepID=UPI003A7FBA60